MMKTGDQKRRGVGKGTGDMKKAETGEELQGQD